MLLEMNIRTLIAVLFWCNITSALLLLSYHLFSYRLTGQRLFRLFFCAKVLQSGAYILLLTRGNLPDVLSVNLSNSLLFVGFYFEALCAFIIINARKYIYYILTALLAAVLLGFNTAELTGLTPNQRVSLASSGVFTILLIPSMFLMLKKDVSRFKRVVGVYYALAALLLLPRAYYMLNSSGNIFTNNTVQTLTFLSLIILMIFTSSAYLLLLKEDTDKTINTLATTDFLTGLSNRYSFIESAERILSRHIHSAELLTLLFCDIDNFKSINDKYGHLFGDQVLKKLAEIIKRNLRSLDLSCRYGGEEFIMLLAQAAPGTIVAERIMKDIADTVFEQHPNFKFTVSIGITYGIPKEGHSINSFILTADEALYEAKNTGKNKVVEYLITDP